MADPNKVDPIHQFAITDVFSTGEGGFALTNSGLFMILTVGLISIYLLASTSGRRLRSRRPGLSLVTMTLVVVVLTGPSFWNAESAGG